MNNKFLSYLIIMLTGLLVACSQEPEPFQVPSQDSLQSSYNNDDWPATFDQFLLDLSEGTEAPDFLAMVDAYQNDPDFKDNPPDLFTHLWAMYAGFSYEEQALIVLEDLVAIPTSRLYDKTDLGYLHIPAVIELFEGLAIEHKLNFENFDDRLLKISLSNNVISNQTAIGLYSSLESMSLADKPWVLSQGQELDPYKLTQIDDRLYGLGVMQNKASLVEGFFALAALQNSPFDVTESMALFIDLTSYDNVEFWQDYEQQGILAKGGIALDTEFSLVTAIKGHGTLSVLFDKDEANLEALQSQAGFSSVAILTEIKTSNHKNNDSFMIPIQAKAWIASSNAQRLYEQLKDRERIYMRQNSGRFNLIINKGDGGVWVQVNGEGGHASEPRLTVNPLLHLINFIAVNERALGLADNGYKHIIDFVNDLVGASQQGEAFGVSYRTLADGPLTIVLTQINEKNNQFEMVFDIRLPEGRSVSWLDNHLNEEIVSFKEAHNFPLSWDLNVYDYWSYSDNDADNDAVNLDLIKSMYNNFTEKPVNIKTSPRASLAQWLPNTVGLGARVQHRDSSYSSYLEYIGSTDLPLLIGFYTELLYEWNRLE